MPKIIDRDAEKLKLAQKAAPLFSKNGYDAMGMRELAKALGISKSALYHYYPSKEALFAAASEYVGQMMIEMLEAGYDGAMSSEEKLSQLHSNMKRLEAIFKDELSLLIEYLRPMDDIMVAQDEVMQHSNQAIINAVSKFVANDHVEAVLTLYYGHFLMRMLNGKQTNFDAIQPLILKICA